jgi:hypothetical protein
MPADALMASLPDRFETDAELFESIQSLEQENQRAGERLERARKEAGMQRKGNSFAN